MQQPPVEVLCRALEESGGQLDALLRSVDDSSPIAVGVWTIGETANHVSGSAAHFLGVATGEAAPERLDDVDGANARSLAADQERDTRVLAERAVAGERSLVAHARTLAGDPPVTPFVGVDVPFSTLLGIELGGKRVAAARAVVGVSSRSRPRRGARVRHVRGWRRP